MSTNHLILFCVVAVCSMMTITISVSAIYSKKDPRIEFINNCAWGNEYRRLDCAQLAVQIKTDTASPEEEPHS